jgi:predicted DsbA family dithiol-disulfide isomerase
MHEITIFSDYICPFCFIGKYRVQQLSEEISIRSNWRPFEIHPETPQQGLAIERFPAAIVERLTSSIGSLAAELGIEIRMPRKLANSRLALLGGEIAREAGKFEAYHEAVFRAYFQSDQDIGDPDVLAQIAEAVGLGADDFMRSVAEKRYHRVLQAAHEQALSLGIMAVPSFILPNASVITGVQSYSLMKQMIEKSGSSQKSKQELETEERR